MIKRFLRKNRKVLFNIIFSARVNTDQLNYFLKNSASEEEKLIFLEKWGNASSWIRRSFYGKTFCVTKKGMLISGRNRKLETNNSFFILDNDSVEALNELSGNDFLRGFIPFSWGDGTPARLVIHNNAWRVENFYSFEYPEYVLQRMMKLQSDT